MQTYRKLRQVHFWLTMVLALPLVILSLTGALLVFGHEIEQQIQPEYWLVDADSEPLPYETLLARFEAQYPGVPVNVIAHESSPGHAWTYWLGNGEGVASIDPATGDVLLRYVQEETFYGFIRGIHRWLAVPGEARPLARDVVSIAALLLIVQLAVGIAMWSIPPRRLKRLSVPLKGSAHLIVMRLHSVTALFLAAVLILIALTGISFNWRETMKSVISAVTFSEIPELGELDLPRGDAARDIDRGVAAAQEALPEGRVLSINVPKQTTTPLRIRFDVPDAVNASLVRVHTATGEVLDIHHAELKTRAEAIMNMAYSLHIGDFGGLPTRILWLVISLMPMAYAISGVWLYLNRTKTKRRARRMRAATA